MFGDKFRFNASYRRGLCCVKREGYGEISGGYRYAAREVAVQSTLAWGLTGDRERDQGMHEDVKK